jgi:hypothetical protein
MELKIFRRCRVGCQWSKEGIFWITDLQGFRNNLVMSIVFVRDEPTHPDIKLLRFHFLKVLFYITWF